MSIARRTAIAMGGAVALAGGLLPASAATPAETFVSDNIDKGLGILDDKLLSQPSARSNSRRCCSA
jgi:hypothetical protein